MISFPVIALDQFLRTAPGTLSAQPYTQAEHWVADSLMMLPLFAAGVWAGDRIAGLAGLGTERRAGLLKRALVIALFVALAQVPAWFVVSKSDNPVTAQPLVFPQAHDSGDVYWVAPWVIPALVCVCLAPAAVWAARGIGRRGTAWTRVAVLALLLAAVPAAAWLLHKEAEHAYASQVYYTSAPSAVTRHSRDLPAGAREARLAAGPSVTSAPFAFAYQAAHALQDGLAGQAAGLPVAVAALLRVTRDRSRHQPPPPQGGAK